MRRKRLIEGREDRHRRALAQTIQWAKDAAIAGHYEDALAWMRVLEAVEGQLPTELEPLLARCLAAAHARAAGSADRRRGLVDAA